VKSITLNLHDKVFLKFHLVHSVLISCKTHSNYEPYLFCLFRRNEENRRCKIFTNAIKNPS